MGEELNGIVVASDDDFDDGAEWSKCQGGVDVS